MDAGWIVLIVVLAWVSLMAVLLAGFKGVSERTVPTPPAPAPGIGATTLDLRLLDALQKQQRAEIDNLLAISGLQRDEHRAEANRTELLEQLRAELTDAATIAPAPAEPRRGVWDFPTSPDDLTLDFDDPTDLRQPLDALPPEGEQPWAPEEPIAFPEPVPELEHRQRAAGFGVGENPLEDLGIVPAWHDELPA